MVQKGETGVRGQTVRTAERDKRFFKSLSKYGGISKAAKAAGYSRASVYEWREKDEAFAEAWKSAVEEATDNLELEARRRAHDGVEKLKFYQGELITVPLRYANGRIKEDAEGNAIMVPYVEHEYSDALLTLLLKAHRPQKFKERFDLTSGDEPLVKAYGGFDPDDV